jgi:hypothetical protein
MRRIHLIMVGLVAALALGGLACSDDDTKQDASTDTIKIDSGQVDDADVDSVLLADTVNPVVDAGAHNIGEKCNGMGDCKSGSPICMNVLGSALKLCTRKCTPDDSTTPLINEDDCADSFVCASFRLNDGKTYNFCLQKCTPSVTKNPCSSTSETTCTPYSSAFGGSGQAVCYEPACKTDKDCSVLSAKSCSLDGDCTAVGTGAYCDTKNGYLCAMPGKCTPGGLCGKHTAGKAGSKVGDPCTSDLDCPDGGRCMDSSVGSSTVGTHYNNGYCITAGCKFATDVPEFACPTGSSCFGMYYEGYCHKNCNMANAAECRGYAGDKGGDYDCYSWDQLSFGSGPASAAPICTSGANIDCSWFSGGSSTMDCSVLGGQGNTTKMSCRDRFTGKAKTNKYDKTGICLDDTPCGTFQTVGDAGVPDSSTTADAGVDAATADAGTADAATVDAATADAATADSAPTVDAAMTH